VSNPADDAHPDGAPLLFGYDGSEDARRAIAVAAALFPGHDAVILAIAAPVTSQEALVESFGPAQDYEEANTCKALSIAASGAAHALRAGMVAEARAEIAVPTWQGIVDVADEVRASVIIVGSHGLAGIRELLEGSISHQIAEHAHRPVMIIPRRRQ
jgi:nucleotide-binding universal stress UspA family protein